MVAFFVPLAVILFIACLIVVLYQKRHTCRWCCKPATPMDDLPEAERRVITMYYREGLLLREIGVVLGVTESRISQIHSRALARLQDMLLEEA